MRSCIQGLFAVIAVLIGDAVGRPADRIHPFTKISETGLGFINRLDCSA